MQGGTFLFGASTSAHQIEGGNTNNDWWQWEKQRPEQFRSVLSVDGWNTYAKDIGLAKQLGHTAHRISIEWSRIEPQEGRFNRAAIEHYKAVLQEVRSSGMKTFVTLHHFTNPLWLSRQGGWESGKTPELFGRYAKYVATHLGDLVDFWITINEPMVYASQSYMKGIWPPQKKSAWATMRVVRTMARAHVLAYRRLHHVHPHIPVGFAKHMIAYAPARESSVIDRLLSWMQDLFFNRLFFSLIRNKQDFIGVNYYFSRSVRATLPPPFMDVMLPSGETSDLGWPISPGGLTQVLLDVKRYNKPIYITENGIADADDSKRADFLRSHIRAIEAAQKQGCDVRGYLHWSLLDNFEWAEGFAPKFGLVAVDLKTQQRTIRPSAYVYKAIIEQSRSGRI